MTIDWTHFTPWTSLGGGLVLGIASALFILMSGRVLGISSILGDLLRGPRTELGWRLAFFAGLLVSPLVYAWIAPLPAMRIDADWATLVVAGLLVGVGTRYGAGCTSGHGVCGLSRLSVRSLAATLTFMGSGFATVFIVRHVLA
nr:YeeE/YedE family protein [uncultured Rhodoferax sp.]